VAAGKVLCTSCGETCGRVYTAPGMAEGSGYCLRCLEEWSEIAEPFDIDSQEDDDGPFFWNR